MASGYRNAAGVDAEDVYDPDVIGDGPVAAINGIGYRKADGTLLRFAALKYGTAAPNHGYRLADGRDFSALWAKKGTSTQVVVIGFGQYMANSSGSHDTGATFTLSFRANGTWDITITALSGGGISGAPRSGSWHRAPAAGIGAGYEIRFTAAVTVADNYDPDALGSYTASTGWLSLSDDRSVTATTGHLLAGGAGSGTVTVGGSYTVDIRRVGSSGAITSVCEFEVAADST